MRIVESWSYEQQYGFRQNFSTNFALIELSDKIADAIDKNKFMVSIFIDLSKACDKLNHDILNYKLSRYGIRGIANGWFHIIIVNNCQLL